MGVLELLKEQDAKVFFFNQNNAQNLFVPRLILRNNWTILAIIFLKIQPEAEYTPSISAQTVKV